jgi:hypothetical protein
VILIAVCTAGLLAPGAALAGTLDQQQTDAGAGKFVHSTQSVAQTFTAGISGGLDQVDLNLVLPGGTPTAYLSVELRDVSAGAPGGMILASQSVPVSSVSASAAFVSVTFAPPAPVVAGGRYAIVAYTAAPSVNGYGWTFSSSLDAYAGGGIFVTANSPPSGAWTPATHDFAFKTYVVPSPATAPTGQRAAALKKCKKKHTHKARKKCKKKAKLLPV